jgi:hypothetical protein
LHCRFTDFRKFLRIRDLALDGRREEGAIALQWSVERSFWLILPSI